MTLDNITVDKVQSTSRQKTLTQWITAQLSPQIAKDITLIPIKSDASARRYYRVFHAATQCHSNQLLNLSKSHSSKNTYQTPKKLLVVDSPPASENSRFFVHVAKWWQSANITVPTIFAYTHSQGFLLLEDLGNQLLIDAITPYSADMLYQQAFQTIAKIQEQPAISLPDYDVTLIQKELNIYSTWFLEKLLCLTLDATEKKALNMIFQLLTENMLEQPQTLVHRDFHSKNLLLCHKDQIGVIDFQGAINGPLLYDPVSLLKDCYLTWSEKQISAWFEKYSNLLPQACGISPVNMVRWFDLTGLQRHLKCLGIFSRLWLKYDKPQYLNSIPNTFRYALHVCNKYPGLKNYGIWLKQRVQNPLKVKIDAIMHKLNSRT